MPLLKEHNAEPIPGYRLIEPLGSGGFGEVWKCEAPGGLFKAIKFVYGNLNGLRAGRAPGRRGGAASIEHVKAIRHPFLLSMDRVERGRRRAGHRHGAGRPEPPPAVPDSASRTGLPGIPRDELLGYLREAAEVLDLLNLQHGLQHLDVKPHNLFLVSSHVKVADFGLVNSLAARQRAAASRSGAVTPLYAAPEDVPGQRSAAHSDQYSLAVVYQELLTGHAAVHRQELPPATAAAHTARSRT